MARDNGDNDFLAKTTKRREGFFSELIVFMTEHKKWWLAPIIISILALGLLVILGGTGAAPFIYTLF